MNNINTAFRGAAGLSNEYFEALVTASMEPYRLAVKRAEQRRDELKVERAVYSDLETKMDALANAVKALRQGDDSVFDDKLATSSDEAVLTASATSSAADATYAIDVTDLAKAHRVSSSQQTDSTSALGLSGTFSVNGVSVAVSTGNSLNDIRDAINQAVQTALDDATLSAEDSFSATIIDNNLVLEADSTGTAYALTTSDDMGTVLQNLGVLDTNGAFASELQAAQDAAFTVNSIDIVRSSNVGLGDVIQGMTLTLKDAGSSTVTVGPNTQAVKNSVKSFIGRLNDFNQWLAAKTGVKENNDGTYSRGVLAGDFSLRGIRRNLVQTIFSTWSGAPSGATYNRLDQLGLELGSELTVSLADADALSSALSSNYDEVVDLFGEIMEDVQTMLDPYTDGTDTLVDQRQAAADSALETQNDRITRAQDTFDRRDEMVRDQIAQQFAAISSYNDTGRFLVSTMLGSGFNAYG